MSDLPRRPEWLGYRGDWAEALWWRDALRVSQIDARSPSDQQGWHQVGDPGEPVFENGWEDVNAENGGLGFATDDRGMLWIAGSADRRTSGGPSTLPIFTLPLGFRPDATETGMQIALTWGGYADEAALVNFDPDGTVWSENAVDYVTFDGWPLFTVSPSALQ